MKGNILKKLSKEEIIDCLEAIQQVAIDFLTNSDPRTLLNRIVEKARELVVADGGSLYLKHDADNLRFEVFQNSTLPGTSNFDKARIPLQSKSLVTYCFNRQEPLIINNAYTLEKDLDFALNKSMDQENRYRTHTVLVVPLLAPAPTGNGVFLSLGVLQMVNRKNFFYEKWPTPENQDSINKMPHFTEVDLNLLQRFSSLAAAALMDSFLKNKSPLPSFFGKP